MNEQYKAVVTVTEMSRMLGFSRARFYQLMKEGVFPQPERLPSTGRPIYSEELQKTCLEVRRSNCGVNGTTVLFYPRGDTGGRPSRKKRISNRAKRANEYPEIRTAVQALGLANATSNEVAQAVTSLYPNGVDGVSQAEVIRAVFLYLQRQNR